MLLSSLIPPISPAITGLLVGAVSGALAFVAFAFAIIRRRARDRQEPAPPVPAWRREAREYAAAAQVLRVPPYAAAPFCEPGDDVDVVSTRAFHRPRGMFSAELSASSLAAVGLHVGPFGQRLPSVQPPAVAADAVGAESEAGAPGSDDEEVDLGELGPPAVTVAPCVIVSAEPKTVHPLAIIKSSSLALAPAAEPEPLVDDCPTEIGQTFFDVKPSPLVRGSRPRIRRIAPGSPRAAGG